MGQFYTYRRPDNILWFQRIRQRMGLAERRAEGIWARRFGRQSIQRAGCLSFPSRSGVSWTTGHSPWQDQAFYEME